MRLITIPLSHYCERARWALDLSDVSYVEDPHLQMFHLRAVGRVSSGHQVPVLVTPDEVLTDSQDILAFADARGAALYPEHYRPESCALELELAGPFGVETRRLGYYQFLKLPRATLLKYNNHSAPWYQRAATWPLYGMLKQRVSAYLDITDETAKTAESEVFRVLDVVAERLSDGRPFLDGDTFTALDLTFASLLAPLISAPQYGIPLPPVPSLPEPLRSLVEALRATPAGQHALRMYSDHRRVTDSRPG